MFASAVLQSWGVPGGRGRNDQEFSAPPTPASFRQEREPPHRPELQTCRFSFPEMNFHSAGSVTCGDSPGSFSPPEMLRQVRAGYPPPSNPASGVSCPGLEMKVTAPSFDFSRGSPGILGAPKFAPHWPPPRLTHTSTLPLGVSETETESAPRNPPFPLRRFPESSLVNHSKPKAWNIFF